MEVHKPQPSVGNGRAGSGGPNSLAIGANNNESSKSNEPSPKSPLPSALKTGGNSNSSTKKRTRFSFGEETVAAVNNKDGGGNVGGGKTVTANGSGGGPNGSANVEPENEVSSINHLFNLWLTTCLDL